MLWTVISQADVFYQAAQGSRAPRSSNPFDYLNNGYSLEGASLFGGQDHVVFNCDISSRRTGQSPGYSRCLKVGIRRFFTIFPVGSAAMAAS